MKPRVIVNIATVLVLFSVSGAGQEGMREDFNSLDNWKPLYFRNIKRHTLYVIVTDKEKSVLRAEADNSASAIILKKRFDVYKTSMLEWKWKITNIYKSGNEKTKSGDDYPVRIFVMFEYDPARLKPQERVKYQLARMMYGEYPPDSSLNFVWASNIYIERILTSPYSDKAKNIIIEQGKNKIGRWIDERVNILEEYRAAFGIDPPRIATLAIMSDADNAGGHAVSFIDFIEIKNGNK
jgi:hypothetical protein